MGSVLIASGKVTDNTQPFETGRLFRPQTGSPCRIRLDAPDAGDLIDNGSAIGLVAAVRRGLGY